MQQASCLEGGPLLWIWPLYLHVNQKSDDDDDKDYTLLLYSSMILRPFMQVNDTKFTKPKMVKLIAQVGDSTFQTSFIMCIVQSYKIYNLVKQIMCLTKYR